MLFGEGEAGDTFYYVIEFKSQIVLSDMKTTWQGSLDDLLIFSLCFKKQKLTGDLPPALSLRGYARFKLPYSYCVNYTACLAT